MAARGAGDRAPSRRPRSGVGGLGGLWLVMGLGLVVVVVLLTPLADRLLPAFSGLGAPPDTSATAGRIVAAPETFFHRTVTVSGEIHEVLGSRVFTLGGAGFLESGELLVVSAVTAPDESDPPAGLRLPAGTAVLTGDIVQVTGPVRRFEPADLAREAGVALDDARLRAWVGKPVVIASTLALTPRVFGETVDRILDDPSGYFGKTVRIRAALARMLGRYAFTLEDSDLPIDGDLLVVSATPPSAIPGWPADDATAQPVPVTVVGTVRPFDPAAVARELGLVLDERLFAGRQGRPVLVARAVAVTPGATVPRPSMPTAVPARQP